MEKIAYIPFKNIRKIEIYINAQKLSLSEIIKSTGCDFAITGNFYNASWQPTCHLKKDGKVLASSSDVYRGFRWNEVGDFGQSRVPTEAQGFAKKATKVK